MQEESRHQDILSAPVVTNAAFFFFLPFKTQPSGKSNVACWVINLSSAPAGTFLGPFSAQTRGSGAFGSDSIRGRFPAADHDCELLADERQKVNCSRDN